MTRRAALIHRRASSGPLSVWTEIPAAQYLRPWLRFPEMSTQRFWESIAYTHGAEIIGKVREAAPGTRPGFMYAAGRLPPLPFIEEPPAGHPAASQYVAIDGVRLHWSAPCGDRPWLRCQAEHLRDVGEVDGREWIDYTRWRDEGFPARYRISGGNRTVVGLHHLCH
jgi:hypothetical protein